MKVVDKWPSERRRGTQDEVQMTNGEMIELWRRGIQSEDWKNRIQWRLERDRTHRQLKIHHNRHVFTTQLNGLYSPTTAIMFWTVMLL